MTGDVPFRWAIVWHVEMLHDGPVWDRLRRMLDGLHARGIPSTLLVTTARSRRAGIDVTSRIGELLGGGWEIGQHTHFYERYDGEAATDKQLSTDPAVVHARMREDHDALLAAGARPSGFSAGGWLIASSMYDFLAANGFEYDVSGRAFALRYGAAPAPNLSAPTRRDGIALLPTTATLTGALRDRLRPARRRGVALGPARATITYLHDYDLTDRRARALVETVARVYPARAASTAGALAGSVAP